MSFTLRGRIETRLFLTLVVGMTWAVLSAPVLPRPYWFTVGEHTIMVAEGMLVVAGAGVVWEFVYHALQQLRWNRDWPSIFSLATVLNEGLLAWVLVHEFQILLGPVWTISSPQLGPFVWLITTSWVVVWLFMQGPLRVLHPRWRYEGGCLLGSASDARYLRARRARRRADAGASEPGAPGGDSSHASNSV